MRTILELLMTVLAVFVIRSIVGGLMRGLAGGSSKSRGFSPGPVPASQDAKGPQLGGALKRDPVCGTFVAETTKFQRQAGRQTFYYCSNDCREKHALVAH